jgi:hypothetical protein
MSRSQSSPLEVTGALRQCARKAGFHFGEDTALVAVQHMLLQTVDLFKTIGELGLSPENIFALGKVYSNNGAVIESLCEMGVNVVVTTAPEPGEFQQAFERDVEKLWQVATSTLAQRRIKRVLILDDGGVCLTKVPADILRRYTVCGVEQTSQGMFLLEDQPPSFGVMLWARAAVKLEIGGSIFARTLIDKMNTRFLHGSRGSGKQLGVIGLGSIGRGVARLAVRQGNRTLFYDPDPALQIPRLLCEKVTRLDSLEELMLRCDYVVGCSGRNPYEHRWPMCHKPGIRLLSASGGDQEFGPIIKDLAGKPDFKLDPITWDITSDNGRLLIAYCGYPYNFVSRAPEAVPSNFVQLETGGLLAGLIQAKIYLEMCEARRETNRGIHRISPAAQHFVYERWVRAMQEQGIDLAEFFACDKDTLTATQRAEWFSDKSEPHPDLRYRPLNTLEQRMSNFVSKGYAFKARAEA